MRAAPDDAERALSAGLSALGSWYGTATLLLSWLAAAQILVAARGPAAALAPAPGVAAALAGGLLLLVRAKGFRTPVVLASVVLLEAGFVLLLLALAPIGTTASLPLALCKTALLAFAVNAGRGLAPLVAGGALFAATEVLCALVGPRLGVPWRFDTIEAALFALLALVTIGVRGARGRAAGRRRAVARAAETEALGRTRAIARSRTAAVVHDTVLNDLAMLATTEPGRLPDPVTDRLDRTLALLRSENWTGGIPIVVPHGTGASEVRSAVDRARAAGLTVRVSGDLTELDRLDGTVEHALGGAVEQCLVNTRQHAGVDEAEVTVLGEDRDVTVMVSDDGAGFDASLVDEDRIGLAASVRARIEDLGGTVRIFARPGFGTTVLLTVPRRTAPLVGRGA